MSSVVNKNCPSFQVRVTLKLSSARDRNRTDGKGKLSGVSLGTHNEVRVLNGKLIKGRGLSRSILQTITNQWFIEFIKQQIRGLASLLPDVDCMVFMLLGTIVSIELFNTGKGFSRRSFYSSCNSWEWILQKVRLTLAKRCRLPSDTLILISNAIKTTKIKT